jgi:hypothetical protein
MRVLVIEGQDYQWMSDTPQGQVENRLALSRRTHFAVRFLEGISICALGKELTAWVKTATS